MGLVTTIHQRFYKASLPPITLEHIDLVSLTTKSVADLVATLSSGTRLGVAATYGEKCVLDALAFSTESRVLLITMNATSSKVAKRQKQILRNEILCNISLEKHGFFMERLAAALHLDLGLYIRNAFDITSGGDNRGSMAAYKNVLGRARVDTLYESVVENIFTEQPFILSRKTEFALRAWASYVAVQALPDKPGAIDTSIKDSQARSTYHP